MRRSLIVISLLSATLFLLVGLVLVVGGKRRSVEPGHLQAAIDLEPLDVEHRPAPPRAFAAAPAPTYGASADGDDPAAAQNPSPKQPGTMDDVHEHVAGVFASEREDPAWAHHAATRLSRSLIPLLDKPGSRATTVECRSTLCRFEVRNTEENAYSAVFETAIHQNVWNAGMFAGRSKADPLTLVVYLAREGHGVPQPGLPN